MIIRLFAGSALRFWCLQWSKASNTHALTNRLIWCVNVRAARTLFSTWFVNKPPPTTPDVTATWRLLLIRLTNAIARISSVCMVCRTDVRQSRTFTVMFSLRWTMLHMMTPLSIWCKLDWTIRWLLSAKFLVTLDSFQACCSSIHKATRHNGNYGRSDQILT